MPGNILLSTAYLPPAEYFARISDAEEVLIEKEENYHKQSFRNRCYILSASGPQTLTVPVYLGSLHKTLVRDIRIDYSKRWQQVHLRAFVSSYSSSPFFLYYYEDIEKIILRNHEFLLDLNMELLMAVMGMIKLQVKISYTTDFMPVNKAENDFRYKINPKKKTDYNSKPYIRVFSQENGFTGGFSIADLLFNMGPEAVRYL
ncbi:MAG: WbqC family protein [Bacteroidia bacterium]|nr:WbqC family protein [Bacteroidia bacterium]